VFLIQWTPSRSTQTGNERFFLPSFRTTLLTEIITFRIHVTHALPVFLARSKPLPPIRFAHTQHHQSACYLSLMHTRYSPQSVVIFSLPHECLPASSRIFFVSKVLWFLIFFVASNLIRQENKMCAYIGFSPHLYWRVLFYISCHPS